MVGRHESSILLYMFAEPTKYCIMSLQDLKVLNLVDFVAPSWAACLVPTGGLALCLRRAPSSICICALLVYGNICNIHKPGLIRPACADSLIFNQPFPTLLQSRIPQ